MPTPLHIKAEQRHIDPPLTDHEVDSLTSTDTVRKGSTTKKTTIKLERVEVGSLLEPPEVSQNPNVNYASSIGHWENSPSFALTKEREVDRPSDTLPYRCTVFNQNIQELAGWDKLEQIIELMIQRKVFGYTIQET